MAMSGGKKKLVHTGRANYGAAGEISLYVYYKSTQDLATNTSTVYVGMYVTTPSDSYKIGAWDDNRGSYVGTTSNTFNGSIPQFAGTHWLVENKTFTVKHDDEGKAKATIYWKWGVNSPWGQMEHPSGSFTIDLPTIARASTITSVGDMTIGDSTKMVWTPKSKAFYYKVKLSIGTWKTTFPAVHPNRTTAYTYTITDVPYAVCGYFESISSKSGTMTATLYTYSDSSCTTQVGAEDTATFEVKLPEDDITKPTVYMELKPDNATGVAWESLYVQGISKVKATLTATAQYSAEITGYRVRVGSQTYNSLTPEISAELPVDGVTTVTGYATDSREFTSTATEDITVIPYGKPNIFPLNDEDEIVVARCLSNGDLDESGECLRIKAKRSYSKIMSDGTQHNFCYFGYRYKKGGGNYSGWYPLLEGTNTETDEVDEIIEGVCSDVTASYTVQLMLQDDVGRFDDPTFSIPTASQDFTLKEGGGDAFGKYAERHKAVEIAGDWELIVHGDRWKSLGIASIALPNDPSVGRAEQRTCSYRVENGNHVYVQVSCALFWQENSVTVSGSAIPEEYRPQRDVFSMCAANDTHIVKLSVSKSGDVIVSDVLDTATESGLAAYMANITWIDGYIDYFI